MGNSAVLTVVCYAPHEYLTAFCPIENRVSTETGVQLSWAPNSPVAAAFGAISLGPHLP